MCTQWTDPNHRDPLDVAPQPLTDVGEPGPQCYSWTDCYWDYNVVACGPDPWKADFKYCATCKQCDGGSKTCGEYLLSQVDCNNTRG